MSVISIKKKYITEENIGSLIVESILEKDHHLLDEILSSEIFIEDHLPLNILHFCILSLNKKAFMKIIKIAEPDILNCCVGIPGICGNKTPLDCLGPKPFSKILLKLSGVSPRRQFEIYSKTNAMRNALLARNAKITVSNYQFKKEMFKEILFQRIPILNCIRFLNNLRTRRGFYEASPAKGFVSKPNFQDW